ncbi:hypothetical protein A2881_03155 [Candidatus Peribacteria bacterium RIFCSPHIGHO2_01_FULL_55_13]|nr:MAG: hypothetical protein A2881_03155 [Candidatus Peribacteria bacterium RIFCSPHIGHO2_01_FULL_55_13]OGJ65993.1 MAG: hypothetical protein A3F36_04760 [Candidatus Peribacteria bacterium RIFCSPHIGHO2_12_FULL_55_11]
MRRRTDSPGQQHLVFTLAPPAERHAQLPEPERRLRIILDQERANVLEALGVVAQNSAFDPATQQIALELRQQFHFLDAMEIAERIEHIHFPTAFNQRKSRGSIAFAKYHRALQEYRTATQESSSEPS